MKKKILFVGENPNSFTGNGHMMKAVIEQLDRSVYSPTLFVANDVPPWTKDCFNGEVPIIPAKDEGDGWGQQKLVNLIFYSDFEAVVTVGIDIWRYNRMYNRLEELKRQSKTRWAAIFPWDITGLREDWIAWAKLFDFPCVYSMYGYDLLRERVPNIRYFRPPLESAKIFRAYSPKERIAARHKRLKTVSDKQFVFGFVGANSIRKDPQKLVEAFASLKKDFPEAVLYMHTEMGSGAEQDYNLAQFMIDCGLTTGQVVMKAPGYKFTREEMVDIYNSIDCLVNCTVQEGLSWTPLEAMLCGTPVIASITTAQTELIQGCAIGVPCTQETYLPVMTSSGRSWIEASSCKAADIQAAMIEARGKVQQLRELGLARGKEYLDGVSDINGLLTDMLAVRQTPQMKKPGILFVQHSSAGDVLMTTRCFRGLKKRHPGERLIYMTQVQYQGIVEGNPYVDEIIDWDPVKIREYAVVYNPHGERIMPGHWGKNSSSLLSDFYWKILDVDPDDFFIQKKSPNDLNHMNLTHRICVVHTTGGDPAFRTYKYMKDICKNLERLYLTIQVGGKDDFPAGAHVDLRGKLTFQETAWVMDKAVLAITVDSFVSHLAGALGVSQVCLFGSGNANVVRPNQMKGELICLVPDYVRDCIGLGPCSASVRNCPAPCTGLHDPKSILAAVDRIEAHGNIRRNHAHEASCHSFQYA